VLGGGPQAVLSRRSNNGRKPVVKGVGREDNSHQEVREGE
jgi:hypothetical protein